MSTKIEWSEETWNPILGCDRVSPGCDRCYAITQARIRSGNPHPKVAAAFAGITDYRDGRLDWTGQVNLLPERLMQPLKWKKPKRIFVNSLSDLFHDAVPNEYIARVFAVMAACPQHSFQILTKRHARMRSLLNNREWRDSIFLRESVLPGPRRPLPSWPLDNVWLGVSVENQQWANIRIPALLETPAAVRWISAEPLLGPVDLSDLPNGAYLTRSTRGLDWVVVGGESGPGARPMHPGWARLLRDQCVGAGVPFLFKQWGSYAPRCKLALCGTPCSCNGDNASHPFAMRRVSKERAGRTLGGRTWDQYPAVTA